MAAPAPPLQTWTLSFLANPQINKWLTPSQEEEDRNLEIIIEDMVKHLAVSSKDFREYHPLEKVFHFCIALSFGGLSMKIVRTLPHLGGSISHPSHIHLLSYLSSESKPTTVSHVRVGIKSKQKPDPASTYSRATPPLKVI